MASLGGSAGGSKQNSNVSISLTSGNLASQLESIKNKAKLTSEQIKEIVDYWGALQQEVEKGKLTQEFAIEGMTENLKDYGISIDNTSKSFEKQKEKIKDVEAQSKVSVKEQIKDEEAYAGSINRVTELLKEQAALLNSYRLSATNRLTPDNVDKIITKIGMNLNSGRGDDKIRHDILDDIGYAGAYHSTIDSLKGNPLMKLYELGYLKIPKDLNNELQSGKYKYSSDISRGLKDPNIMPDINDILAMAVLNADEFENYAKNTGYYDDLMGNYERFQARLWNSGSFKGTSQDFTDMTDIADRYLTRGIENKNAFMNALGIDNTSLRQKAQQAKDNIIKALETGIYERAVVEEGQILDDLPFTDYDNFTRPYTSNTPKQLPALNYIMDYENRMKRRGRALYTLGNNYAYGNDVINAYGPQYEPYPANIIFGQGKIYGKGFTAKNSLNLPAVVEGTYREITDNVDKINQATQQTANEIITKAQQATPTIEQATQATHNIGKALGGFAQDVVSVFTKIGRDMSLTFRDFGNTIRTWSSVMYSAIHLVQALENVMNVSDSMTAIAYRLERYDTTGASRQTLLNRAFSRANNARSDIDSYATLAQRILATGVTSGNADEAMRIASLITKSMVLGGSTAQEQKSAQLQLSQALASNILGGDELRAIRENAIGFTEMLAKGLTRGYAQGIFTDSNFADVQIGDLKGLGKKQLLTADVVTKAISLMEEEINRDFTTMPELFSQTMAKLMNTFKKRLNEFNQEGKGLGRIVKMFQDLQKWLDSDKGKQVLDSLLDVFDKFIDKISQIVSIVGDILNGPIGKGLLELVKLKISLLPITMGSKLLFGSSDIYGNQRAGLLGYGGVLNIASRALQLAGAGGNPLTGAFSAETINGRTFAMGGLLPNIGSMLVQFANAITGKGYGSNFGTTVLLQKTLMDMLSSTGNHTAESLRVKLLGAGVSKKLLDETIFADNWVTYTKKSGEEITKLVGRLNDRDVATSLLNNNVYANLATNAAGAGVGNALGNPVANAFAAKGGIIGKALGFAAAHPIATAIAAVIGVAWAGNTFIRKPHLEKAYNEDLNSFLDNLPNPAHWSKLQEEDRTALRNKATEWHKKYTEEGFWNINRTYTDKDYEKFVRDYLDFGNDAYGRYLKSIADNTGETAANTASTLDITDEFIRNMNDIRTRSFRGELLMNGNGVNNTWNVVVHNEGDVKNIAEQIQRAVIAAQEGMLNTPVVM